MRDFSLFIHLVLLENQQTSLSFQSYSRDSYWLKCYNQGIGLSLHSYIFSKFGIVSDEVRLTKRE